MHFNSIKNCYTSQLMRIHVPIPRQSSLGICRADSVTQDNSDTGFLTMLKEQSSHVGEESVVTTTSQMLHLLKTAGPRHPERG